MSRIFFFLLPYGWAETERLQPAEHVMELINSVIAESWAMQCTSICSPLEGKEMGKGCVETNSNTFYNFAETPAFQMYLMLWAPRWKMNRAELGEMHLERMLRQTQLLLFVRVGRATFDQLISILSMQTSALVLAAAAPSSLLPSPEPPIHLSFPHFLLFCSHLRSGFRLLWWPNGF